MTAVIMHVFISSLNFRLWLQMFDPNMSHNQKAKVLIDNHMQKRNTRDHLSADWLISLSETLISESLTCHSSTFKCTCSQTGEVSFHSELTCQATWQKAGWMCFFMSLCVCVRCVLHSGYLELIIHLLISGLPLSTSELMFLSQPTGDVKEV